MTSQTELNARICSASFARAAVYSQGKNTSINSNACRVGMPSECSTLHCAGNNHMYCLHGGKCRRGKRGIRGIHSCHNARNGNAMLQGAAHGCSSAGSRKRKCDHMERPPTDDDNSLGAAYISGTTRNGFGPQEKTTFSEAKLKLQQLRREASNTKSMDWDNFDVINQRLLRRHNARSSCASAQRQVG